MHSDNPLNLQIGDRLVDNDRRWDVQRIITVEAVFRLGPKWYFRYTTERGRRSRVSFDHVYTDAGHPRTQGYTVIR